MSWNLGTDSESDGVWTASFSGSLEYSDYGSGYSGTCCGANSCVEYYKRSQSIVVAAGTTLQFQFRVNQGGDWYEVMGGIFKGDDNSAFGTAEKVWWLRGDAMSDFISKGVTIQDAGTYFIAFYGGSYDRSNGGALGATIEMQQFSYAVASTIPDCSTVDKTQTCKSEDAQGNANCGDLFVFAPVTYDCISCGDHNANSCSECGNGEDGCGGDCKYDTQSNTCLTTAAYYQQYPPTHQCYSERQNKQDPNTIEAKLLEVFCLCDDYRSAGFTWELNELSDDLETKVEDLRDAGGSLTGSSPNFLKKWKKRLGFAAHLHDNVDVGTVDFFHRRVWRKVCRAIRRPKQFLIKAAKRLDAMQN